LYFNQLSSNQFVALEELGLRGNRYVSEVENFAEERFAGRPLHHFFFREEQKAASESHQEDQLEKVDPSSVQDNLYEWLFSRLLMKTNTCLRRLLLMILPIGLSIVLVLVTRMMSIIELSLFLFLPAREIPTAADHLTRWLVFIDDGLRSKERREAADAHDEGQGEEAELVAGGRSARIALEDEADFRLVLEDIAGRARRWWPIITSVLARSWSSLMSNHLLAIHDRAR